MSNILFKIQSTTNWNKKRKKRKKTKKKKQKKTELG